MDTDHTQGKGPSGPAFWLVLLLLRLFSRGMCWHCRTHHDGILMRNNRGMLYCADRSACTRRRHARGWDDEDSYEGTRLFFGEASVNG
jgi:hypothetical protein